MEVGGGEENRVETERLKRHKDTDTAETEKGVERT